MVPVKDVYNISKFGAGMTLAHAQGCSQVSDQDCLPHLGIQECCPPLTLHPKQVQALTS